MASFPGQILFQSVNNLFSTDASEIKSLNGLRAFAIIFVLINHYALNLKFVLTNQPILELIYSNFWFGVDLFFVLSGFLISKGLWFHWQKFQSIDFRSFYIKRTLRIFPAYYFFLIITVTIAYALLKFSEKKGVSTEVQAALKKGISNVWGDFLFVGNYFPGIHNHTWSLSIEEQFYLLFPILCGILFFKLKFPKRQSMLWIFYLIPLLMRIITFIKVGESSKPPYYGEIYSPLQTRFDSLIIGVIVMDLFYNNQNFSNFLNDHKKIYHLLSILFFSALIFCLMISPHNLDIFSHTLRYNLQNLSFAGIMYLALINVKSPISNFLSLKVFTPFAKLSYTIYLWHFIFMGIALAILKVNQNVSLFSFHINFIFVLLIQLLLSIPLYLLIELPFQKLRTKLL